MNERSPIGIFDSGIGGLSVLNHLIKHLPNEDFIYIADNKNFPYGLKSSEVIESIILRIGYYFEEVGVKAIVIACNTASSKVDFLRKHLKVKLISIIEPTARNAMTVSNNKTIGLLGTRLTIESRLYNKYLNDVTLYPLICSNFVDLVETGKINKPKTKILVHKHLSLLKNKNLDTIILGCTHFSYLFNIINDEMNDVTIVDSSLSIMDELKEYLISNQLLNPQVKGEISLITTKDINTFLKKLEKMKLKYNNVKEINL